jgi:hypothetical protein
MNAKKLITLSGAVLLALTSTCLADDWGNRHNGNGNPGSGPPGGGHGPLQYVYTTVNVGPYNNPPGTIWFGINNSGELVGNTDGNTGPGTPEITVATILDKGVLTLWSATLADGSASPWSEFMAVNDSGQILGDYEDDATPPEFHLFTRSRGGDITLLPPVEPGAFFVSESEDLNNEATIVGTFTLDANWVHDFFIGGDAVALAAQGFILKDGRYTTWAYPGATSTFFSGLNDKGTIAGGWVDSAGNWNAFLLNKDGSTTSIVPPASLSPVLGGYVEAIDVNNNDEVLVQYTYYDDTTGVTVPSSFVLSHGIYTQIYLPSPQYPIDTIIYPQRINDEGVIVGGWGPGGNEGFVATPVH